MTTEDRAGVAIRADRELCIGSGMCTLTAPEVFDQDSEDGLVRLLRTGLPRAHPDLEAARDAAGVCPAEAISVE